MRIYLLKPAFDITMSNYTQKKILKMHSKIIRDDLSSEESVERLIDFIELCSREEMKEYGKSIAERHWEDILKNSHILFMFTKNVSIHSYYKHVSSDKDFEKFLNALEKIDTDYLFESEYSKKFPFIPFFIWDIHPEELMDRFRKFWDKCIYMDMDYVRNMEELDFYIRLSIDLGMETNIYDVQTFISRDKLRVKYPEYFE